MGHRERREQRRWMREMKRDLAQLETAHGHEEPSAGLPAYELPRTPRSPRTRREPRLSYRSRTYLGGLLALVAAISIVTVDRGGLGGDGDKNYAFFQTQPGTRTPVAWNPCEPIHYLVNPENAPDEWEALVEDSVAEVSEASGLEFEYDGETADRDFSDRGGRLGDPEPVLIGWADAEEVPDLTGDVAGVAGPVSVTSNGRGRYVTGMVVLDAQAYERMSEGRDGDRTKSAILMHELGHLVGLDHVDDRSELMFANNTGQTEFGPGDLAGLEKLGDVGC
ncbi:MAG: matrixin family metalloprotease [Nocardioides sp.]